MPESEFRRRIEIKTATGDSISNDANGEKRSEIVGQIITRLRLNRGYTQQEISDAIGIARQTYAGYERGYHEPSIEALISLAEIYGVSLDLITGRYETTRLGYIAERRIDEAIDSAEREDIEIQEKIELQEYRQQKRKYNRAKKRSPSQG